MLQSIARRVLRSVRAVGRSAAPGDPAGVPLGAAHHETRARLEALEAQVGVLMRRLDELSAAHHATAVLAREARAEAFAARGEAETVAAHLPTLRAVVSSHDGASRQARRVQRALEERVDALARALGRDVDGDDAPGASADDAEDPARRS